MVAVPSNEYDFRSGSSLAAAHVTGVIALFLAVAPQADPRDILHLLQSSQADTTSGLVSIDACKMINLAKADTACSRITSVAGSEVDTHAE